MRYPPEHKAEIRQKIVKDASLRVREEGLAGAAVVTVMRDTGLTHGGFYKHFESKDELLLESIREAFREIADTLVHAAEQSHAETPWKAIVKAYLSLEYCDHVERGCPLPYPYPWSRETVCNPSPGKHPATRRWRLCKRPKYSCRGPQPVAHP